MKYRSTIDRLCRIHTHGLIQDSYSNKKHYRTRKKSIFCLSMRAIVLGWTTRLYDCFIHLARSTLLALGFVFLYVINATFCLLRVFLLAMLGYCGYQIETRKILL